jgi:hypothetical protein
MRAIELPWETWRVIIAVLLTQGAIVAIRWIGRSMLLTPSPVSSLRQAIHDRDEALRRASGVRDAHRQLSPFISLWWRTNVAGAKLNPPETATTSVSQNVMQTVGPARAADRAALAPTR